MIKQTVAITLCLTSLLSATAVAATCNSTLIGNGSCDCGCADSDCPPGDFDICQTNQCPAGKVPWEHSPASCMSSACGDGWNDTSSGEVCDDGNALASGGCSADCKSVNVGFVCGQGAAKCHLAPVDAGSPVPDAGMADSGSVDGGVANGGVSDAGAADAGQPAVDAGGASESDAGAENTKPPPQGCTSVPAQPLLLGTLLLWVRRRRSSHLC